ncbi:uncharacterized protein [Palaemon carinicauda]|uniref:uncharacterized protein n=1 Tax=Palaemon carinicauda TaxID=392227 RepID=UPI0035B5F4B2
MFVVKSALTLMAILSLLQRVCSLECYVGVPGRTIKQSCDEGSCQKIYEDIDYLVNVFYQCEPLRQKEGCHTTTAENRPTESSSSNTFEVCYCNTDLCNNCSCFGLAPLLLLIAMLAKMLV